MKIINIKKLPTLGKTKRYGMYIELYLDYVNNFLTLTRFAEHYEIDNGSARAILDIGEYLNEKLAQQNKL